VAINPEKTSLLLATKGGLENMSRLHNGRSGKQVAGIGDFISGDEEDKKKAQDLLYTRTWMH